MVSKSFQLTRKKLYAAEINRGTAVAGAPARAQQRPVELRLSASNLLDWIAALIPPMRRHRQRYFGVLATFSTEKALAPMESLSTVKSCKYSSARVPSMPAAWLIIKAKVVNVVSDSTATVGEGFSIKW